MSEEMELLEVHEAEFVETLPTPETFEQKQERLRREDYARRNAEAMVEREAILRRNGLLKDDEPFTPDTEAAISSRCCF